MRRHFAACNLLFSQNDAMPFRFHLPTTSFISPVSQRPPSPSYSAQPRSHLNEEEGEKEEMANVAAEDEKNTVEAESLTYIECDIVTGSTASACGFTIPCDKKRIANHLMAHVSAGELFTADMHYQLCPFLVDGRVCTEVVRTVKALSIHLFYTHFGLLNSLKVTCPLCGKMFSVPGNMKRHRLEQHDHVPRRSSGNARESLLVRRAL